MRSGGSKVPEEGRGREGRRQWLELGFREGMEGGRGEVWQALLRLHAKKPLSSWAVGSYFRFRGKGVTRLA